MNCLVKTYQNSYLLVKQVNYY